MLNIVIKKIDEYLYLFYEIGLKNIYLILAVNYFLISKMSLI